MHLFDGTLRSRVILFTGVIAAAMLLANGANLVSARSLSRASGAALEGALPAQQALGTVGDALASVDGVGAKLLNSRLSDLEVRRALFTAAEGHLKALDAASARFAGLPKTPGLAAAWSEFVPARDAWREQAERLLGFQRTIQQAREAGRDQDDPRLLSAEGRSMEAFGAMAAAYRQADDALAKAEDANDQQAAALRSGATAAASRTTWVSLLALVLGLAAVVFTGLGLHRSIAQTSAALVAEAERLVTAVDAGRLDERAEPGTVAGEFRVVVVGLNRVLDALVRPLRVTSATLVRIGRGDLPAPIEEAYQGDFEVMKQSLNQSIAAVNGLLADARGLTQAAVEGRLTVRADPARHQGDFRKVIEGVNATLDAVIGPLTAAAGHLGEIAAGRIPPRIETGYPGDFGAVRDNLNRCIAAVNALVEDAEALARAGVEGRLSARADASRHQGDYRKVIEGVNGTLDTVVGPVTAAAAAVDQLARGELPARGELGWKGDFGTLEKNLGHCIDAIAALVTDVQALAGAAAEGRLSKRADAARHRGEYRRIVEGVNATFASMVAPVEEASRVLDALSQRDLRARAAGDFKGDHARLRDALNATAAALHESMSQVAEATDQVSSASTQIASSSQAVAGGASQQAASIQETMASLERISGATRAAAEGAGAADRLARQARGSADEGTRAMGQMSAAMGQIRAAAEGTAQIIKDINEIAFQTNLLALNAAVEAARAGEAGRGFAVVAEEVRSLALRSKEAAQKTEALIKESVRQAESGEATSQAVSTKLGEIAGAVAKVSDLVGEIAAAAKEQAAGFQQVSHAVTEMDRVTQQNAASAEESSSAASELSGQSGELASMVGSFRLDRGAGHRAQRRLT
jgi:methyl-accepting chemotaxis protein